MSELICVSGARSGVLGPCDQTCEALLKEKMMDTFRCERVQRLSRRRVLQVGFIAAAGVGGAKRDAVADAKLAKTGADTQESLNPLVVDPQHYHLEFENEFVKVIR